MQFASWKKLVASASLVLVIGSAHAIEYPVSSPSPIPSPSPTGAPEVKKSLLKVRNELLGRKPKEATELWEPSAESLIGKYLAETGAQSIMRTFLTAPAGNENPPSVAGAKKLVVAVSEDTFPAFKEKLTGKNYLYIFHTPGSGTLSISFDGKVGYPVYGRNMSDLHFSSPGTMMVPILLDTEEADRVATFIKAGLNPGTNTYVNRPWVLRTKTNTTYSAPSAFDGCTHWFGNIPIGNQFVDSYYFPAGDSDPTGAAPQTKRLEEWDRPAGMTDADEALLRQIWTVPGRQQLGEVIAPDANRRGEFTNVGWIMYTLLGSVGIDRAPVAYLFVRDEKAAIDPNFPLQIYQH